MTPTSRGRPKGQLTARRKQVLEELCLSAQRGERVTMAELARRCGLYDYRHARRIVKELRSISDARW